MQQYLDLLSAVVNHGSKKTDRTGIGTTSIFGYQMRFDLSQGFPAVTTKKLAWNAVKAELLWFLEGSTDERRLAEILHGTRDPGKSTIWTANAQADYWQPRAKFDGDLGRVYGAQWRDWSEYTHVPNTSVFVRSSVDQIANLIQGIKNDPDSRRHILSAWNPAEIKQMALPPCHLLCQFVVQDEKLHCQLYQRSGDVPLGIPFNIASYSLLTHMIAQVCDLGVGHFIHTIGDAHIYNNQLDMCAEQLKRDPLPLPKLSLNPAIKCIDDFKMDDIVLENYQCHPGISYPFAV